MLSKQLKRDAVWPMPAEQEAAKRAIQQLACEAIRLAVIGMVGVTTGERPLEQVADFCRHGWGGAVYQLGPNRKVLNVLGMYGGCKTLSKLNWH